MIHDAQERARFPRPEAAPNRRAARRDPAPPKSAPAPRGRVGRRNAPSLAAAPASKTEAAASRPRPHTPPRPGGAPPGGGRRRSRGWFLAEEPDVRARGLWLILAFAAIAVAIGWRLVDVQILQHSQLSALAAGEHIAEVPLHAHRGRIFDSQGGMLASDLPVYAVFADPGVIPPDQRHGVAVSLGPVLGIGPGLLEQSLNQTNADGTTARFVYLAHGVTEDTKRKLGDLGIYGIAAIPEDQRIYESSALPGASLASNLIGFVDHDGKGQYGVEGFYDKVLRGQDGADSTVRDLSGQPIVLGGTQHRDAQNGSDLRLGVDARVQYAAEQALAQQVTDSASESGTVMVMDTKTGSIRAWADYPTYDANHYATQNVSSFRDLSINGLYEPGSVMKVVTFAAGLDRGVISPQDRFNEHIQTIDGFTIHDWDGRSAHPDITFQWVLDDSLNNGAIEVMRRTGNDAFYRNLLAFGIGSPTGIDLAGETSQPLTPQSTWTAVDFATTSFGQHVEVTPVEMLAAINAVANGGVWVQPHAVDAVIDATTGQETAVSPASRQVMSPAAAATLKQMMTGVVEDRGASGFDVKIPAFKGDIGAKTGTAQVAVAGRYGNDVIASFTGFMPADGPQFTMLVILRKPQHCTFDGHAVACEGAYIAAPVWKQMAQVMVDDWKIVPARAS